MKKRILITGGNKGIGLECTCLFLQNNYKIVIIAKDFKEFEFNSNDNVEKIEYDVSNIEGISDLVRKIGHPDIWYGISKAGLINITKSFAKLLASKGIVINAVAPGPVETDMMAVIPEQRKKRYKE